MKRPDFLDKQVCDYNAEEWEALCDGCGLCCQIREQDIDTNEIALTNIACRYLCLTTHRCTDYDNRQSNVEDCIRITPQNIHGLDWLPHTCAYRVIARGEALPDWHYLICGDPERVHIEGPSMREALISEEDIEADRWEEN